VAVSLDEDWVRLDVVFELDAKGQIMGLEIWDVRKNGFTEQVAKAVV